MAEPFPIELEQLNAVLASNLVPHNTALGLHALDCGPGWTLVRLPYAERLVGNPETGVLHGGAITATLDAVCGLSVFLAMLDRPRRIATIDLRIDYMGPAPAGRDVLVRGECYKVTRNVAFSRGVAYIDDPSDPVANAAGAFMIFESESSSTLLGLGVK